jgi:hypothetical protein
MFLSASPARANEIWVTPTYQQDTGGFGIGSNTVWPVTANGSVRLAWAVPGDLVAIREARLALIPHSSDPSSLNGIACTAEHGDLVGASCTKFVRVFTGVVNRLVEIDLSDALAAYVGTPGANYIAVFLQTTPTQATDHIVGLRFTYEPTLPAISQTPGRRNTFTKKTSGTWTTRAGG